MAGESGLRRWAVRTALKDLHPKAVEVYTPPGYPDIDCVGALIECKHVVSAPKRPTTPLRLRHFTPQQRIFMEDRWKAGGAIYGLLQVGDEVMLHDGLTAALTWGRATMDELRSSALVWTSHRNELAARALNDAIARGRTDR